MVEVHTRARTLMREAGLELPASEAASCRRHCVKVCRVECPVWRSFGCNWSDNAEECAFFQPRKVATSEKPVGPETYCTALCVDVCKKFKTQSCPTWFYMHERGYEVVEGKVGKCVSYYLDELIEGRVQGQPFKPSVNVRVLIPGYTPASTPVKPVQERRLLEKEAEEERLGSQKREQGVCPKCGKLGIVVKKPRQRSDGVHIYIYMRHYDPETQKVQDCYIMKEN